MALSLANLYMDATSIGAYSTVMTAAVAVAAVAVLAENSGSPTAPRLAWAQKTLLDPVSMAKKMIWGVLADPNVIAAMPSPSDAIVQTSVNSLVAAFVNA